MSRRFRCVFPSDFENDDTFDAELQNFCISPDATIESALSRIDHNGRGIVLVVDEQRRLLGTITDGDVRRAFLARTDMQSSISTLLTHRASTKYPRPITVLEGTTEDELEAVMRRHSVHQLPVVDHDNRVVGLVTWEDLKCDQHPPMEAVIMAGGFGKRLHPLTNDTPKPMLPVGGRPLMEVAVCQLQQAGVRRVNITTHYLPEKIHTHFGDGRRFGVDLNYVNEESPLGTAGALQLLEPWQTTLLVMNGDILTNVDFRKALSYHREHKAWLTVAVRKYDFRVPFGVVENENSFVKRIVEKPQMEFFVNAGIYLLEPQVRDFIPQGQRYDMPDLIRDLVDRGHPVASFPVVEYWLDIGQHTDYERAQIDIRTGKVAA